MASVFWIKGKIDSPMEWYSNKMGCESDWKFDDWVDVAEYVDKELL